MTKDIRPAQDDQGPDEGHYKVWSYFDEDAFNLIRWHTDDEERFGFHQWFMEVNYHPHGLLGRLKDAYRMLKGVNIIGGIQMDRKSMKELREAIDYELNRKPIKSPLYDYEKTR